MIKTRSDELKLNEHLFKKMLKGWEENAYQAYRGHITKALDLQLHGKTHESEQEYSESCEQWGRYKAISDILDAYDRQVLYKGSEKR